MPAVDRNKRTTHLNVRFSPTGKYLLSELQTITGLSQASIVELLLREEARRRGITIPGSGAHLKQREEQEELAEQIARRAEAMRKAGR